MLFSEHVVTQCFVSPPQYKIWMLPSPAGLKPFFLCSFRVFCRPLILGKASLINAEAELIWQSFSISPLLIASRSFSVISNCTVKSVVFVIASGFVFLRLRVGVALSSAT